MNDLTTEQQSAFNNWVGSTTGESAGIGGEVGLTLWEMYQMNNLKKQVANCVLNDFVPDPILYNIFRNVEILPEGNLGYVRNGLTGLYYRLTMPAGISRIAAYVDDPGDFNAAVVALLARTLENHLNRPINIQEMYQ